MTLRVPRLNIYKFDLLSLSKITLQALWKMEKLAYDDAMFAPLYTNVLSAIQSSKLNDAVWFWAGRPFPNLERAWLSK